MSVPTKTVRQSITLPAKTAIRVRSMAKARHLSATRMMVELIESGLEAEQRKHREFTALAERYRAETDPRLEQQLGDALGRMIFGDWTHAANRAVGSLSSRNPEAPAAANEGSGDQHC